MELGRTDLSCRLHLNKMHVRKAKQAEEIDRRQSAPGSLPEPTSNMGLETHQRPLIPKHPHPDDTPSVALALLHLHDSEKTFPAPQSSVSAMPHFDSNLIFRARTPVAYGPTKTTSSPQEGKQVGKCHSDGRQDERMSICRMLN